MFSSSCFVFARNASDDECIQRIFFYHFFSWLSKFVASRYCIPSLFHVWQKENVCCIECVQMLIVVKWIFGWMLINLLVSFCHHLKAVNWIIYSHETIYIFRMKIKLKTTFKWFTKFFTNLATQKCQKIAFCLPFCIPTQLIPIANFHWNKLVLTNLIKPFNWNWILQPN